MIISKTVPEIGHKIPFDPSTPSTLVTKCCIRGNWKHGKFIRVSHQSAAASKGPNQRQDHKRRHAAQFSKQAHPVKAKPMRMRPGGRVLTNSLGPDAHQPIPGDQASCCPSASAHHEISTPLASQDQTCSRPNNSRPALVVLDQSPHSTPPRSFPSPGSGAYLNTATPTSSLQEEQHYQILAQH